MQKTQKMVDLSQKKRMTLSLFFSLVFMLSDPAAAASGALGALEHGGTMAPQDKHDPAKRVWNFRNMPLTEIMNMVSRETEKVFLIDQPPNQSITLNTVQPMNTEELYHLFLQILSVYGYVAVPDKGNIVKIVQRNEAKYNGIYAQLGADNPGEFVVQVIPLRYVTGENVLSVVQNALPNASIVSYYAPSNSLIIGDQADNIAQVVKIIHNLDQKSSHSIHSVQLKKGLASDVVNKLKILLGGDKSTHPWIYNVVANDLNNEIIYSNNDRQEGDLSALIQKIEEKSQSDSMMEIIRLKFQSPSDLIPVLASVSQSYYSHTTIEAKATMIGNLTQAPTLVDTTLGSSSSSSNSMMGRVGPFFQGGAGMNGNMGGNNMVHPPGFVIGAISVQAENGMNALVINAPKPLMHLLKKVIQDLDVRKPQVLVEAVVAEVSRDLSREFGIEWTADGGTVMGSTSFSSPATIMQKAKGSSGVLPIPGGLSIGFIRNMDVRGLIKIIASDADTNILSTPSVVTIDGKQATIKVVESVPILTGSANTQQTINGNTTPFNTYSYQEVGLVLDVLPRITSDDAVQMQVHQQVEELIPNSDSSTNPSGNPSFTKRDVNTAVLVNDREIVVLGGLISGKNTSTISKIPVLGDIPLVGNLFKRTKLQNNKKTLMVFLRPIVLRDGDTTKAATQERYRLMRAAQKDLEQKTPMSLDIDEGMVFHEHPETILE